MKATHFTPTELGNFLECEHRSSLDRLAKSGKLARPGQTEVERQLLSLRGHAHEEAVLAHYRSLGLGVTAIAQTPGDPTSAVAATFAALERGDDVVYQGTLRHGDWLGRPDFLVKRVTFGGTRWPHHYEVVDAKLAREAKAAAVLQLCAYTEQLTEIQRHAPERFHIVPGGQGVPIALRVADYLAYYRTVRQRFEASVAIERPTYPEPVEHCAVCPWWKRCESERRADDHLSLVASITRRQRDRLAKAQISTLRALAELSPDVRVDGLESLPRLREQAHLQAARRADGKMHYRLLGDADRKDRHVPPGTKPKLVGLEALPPPTPGDLFLDLEGDAFIDGGGLEYLFGLLELGEPLEDEFTSRDAPGDPRYLAFWAKNAQEEQRAFEAVIDRIVRGRAEFRQLHVFHFGHRESDALKKLSCRYKSREAEVDQLLREHVLVDLHPIVRHAVVASVEGYTLKELEPLHGFARTTDLRGAARAMQLYGFWLETRDESLEPSTLERPIEAYNREDCLSTWQLRSWLESRRREFAEREGRAPARPEWSDAAPDAERSSKNEASAELARRLRDGAGKAQKDDPAARAHLLLADLLDWHWREAKSSWWEYHRARELAPDDYLADRAALAGLEYEGEVGKIKLSLVHRYRFPDQDHAIRARPTPIDPATEATAGSVVAIGEGFIDLKRGTKSTVPHPRALIPGTPIDASAQEKSLAAHGKNLADDPRGARLAPAAWRLLRRAAPELGQPPGAPLVGPDVALEQALPRLALAMKGDVLAIQGPPGSGKTHLAATMILELVRHGQRVGVTANSHEVVKGLLRKIAELSEGKARLLHIQDADDAGADPVLPFELDDDKPAVLARLARGELDVVGGTAWAWSHPTFAEAVDCLVVDEAGQVSLANVLAVTQAAKNLVLVGDPAQLEQPQKGVHPPGAETSALHHLLGGDAVTISPTQGVFIPTTRRLNPALCGYVSEAFYDGRLSPIPGLETQALEGDGPFRGAGLRFVPVEHRGNTNQSPEEVAVVVGLIDQLGLMEASTSPRTWFVHRDGRRALTRDDVLVVAPYNAQVSALERALPRGVRTGTVDKFQGKEAPVVIYSMATSTAADAPRGLEFLYSKNRLNVAVSRAKALAVLVASPALAQVACRTPRQMVLANALCRFVELAQVARSDDGSFGPR
jgi:predicted RecB family nuclease